MKKQPLEKAREFLIKKIGTQPIGTTYYGMIDELSEVILDYAKIYDDNKPEYILCSAVWYVELPLVYNGIPSDLLRPKNCERGIVFCGLRHPHCLYQMVAMTGKYQHEAGEEVQGFLTSENRFVDRKEGAKIHVSNGGKLNYSTTDLYSEDLY